jgi:3-oxoacyl-[acyl-carrier protein] reductase
MYVDFGLSGKVVAVAAASKGLGFACAKALVDEGALVAICGRDQNALEQAQKALGESVLAVQLDLLEPGACEKFIDATVAKFGRLDAIVTNTGGPPAGDILDFDDEAFRNAFELNALTHIRLSRASLPHLRAHAQGGRIVMITSAAVRQPIDGLGLSNTARAGLTGYAKTLSNRLAPEGITVNTVAPGLHDTERLRALAGNVFDLSQLAADVPAARLGDAADFGAVVGFLISKQANYITGQTIVVDGGRMKATF